MAGKIFINYRRGDDPGNTGRLFDRLQDVFQPQQLFLDVDNIAPGLDFVHELNERVAECDIVLAVIGKLWIDARDAAGSRRLDDPDDFVRIEISSALNLGKRVIPVLVGEAQMPQPEELPEVLRPLVRRNAVRLTHERFRADTQGLVKAIQQGLAEIDAQRKAEAEAARHAQEEDERKRQEVEAARHAREEAFRKKTELEARERAAEERRQKKADAPRQSRHPPWQAIIVSGALTILLLAGGAYLWVERTSLPPPNPQVAAVVTPPPAPASLSPLAGAAPPADISAQRTPDAVAWSILKEATDDATLKRFTEQYPNSPFRKDAETRMAALLAVRAAKAADAATKADAAMRAQAAQEAEAAARLEAANKELEAERARTAAPTQQSSSQQLSLLARPDAGQSEAAAPSGSALIRAIKMELTRVGCYTGKLDDDWTSSAVKELIMKFVKAASLARAPDNPSSDFLSSIRSQPSRVCPLVCGKGYRPEHGSCVAISCERGLVRNQKGDCVRDTKSAAQPTESGSADTGSQILCERGGCRTVPKSCHMDMYGSHITCN